MRFIIFLILAISCTAKEKSSIELLSDKQLDQAKIYRSIEEIKVANPDSVYKIMFNGIKFETLPESILSLSSLQYLSINYSSLNQISESDIESMPYLQVLDLQQTSIKSLPENINNLKYLKILTIDHTSINTLPMSLNTIDSLKIIDLGMTDIPIEDLKGFKVNRPDVTIYLEYAVEYDTSMTEESITELYDQIIDDM